MTNTLVSEHLALPSLSVSQISSINKTRSRIDSSMPETLEAVEPLHSNRTSASGKSQEQFVSSSKDVDMQPVYRPLGITLRSGRKAVAEPVSDNWGFEKMTSNKRVASVGPNSKVLSVSPSFNKKVAPNTPRTIASGKKVMHLESSVSKSHSTISKKDAQSEVSPKGHTVSNDSVRAKLRESLSSALALVTQQIECSSDGKMKMEPVVEAGTQEGLNEQKPLVCSPGAPNIEVSSVVTSGSSGIFTDQFMDDKKTSLETQFKESCREDTQTWNYMGPEFQTNCILSGEDSIFGDGLFFKDELLQGNGLSWVSDTDPHISDLKEVENIGEDEMTHEEVCSDEKDEIILSPDSLALEIEAELFKLYGGVNKKYKEKGRSLLFNLKDRNNPELRERVMSGEIPPDRLCSMTAEELASKELSQWRIAKAEELDQMKVLPQSDANMRRLVKKTHKGEYQVDLEPDVDDSEEISPIISVPSQKRLKTSDSDASGPPPNADSSKSEHYEQCEITIPGDGTDMQGLMVDDVKDLPPIVSLDEFMESLNKEPPFENLHVHSETTTVETDREKPNVNIKSMSPVHPVKLPVNTTSQKTEELNMEVEIRSVEKKSGDIQKGLGTKIDHHLKQVPVWEGLLQLNISSMAKFEAFYKSGEKANTNEWEGFFDIKGRVRLDAFDKFLQALPMSRSRAIMVSHFTLKEESTDSERSGLVELVDSYIADERLGFAEPAPGVELYLCPLHTKTVDMIINHLPKSCTEKLNDIDDGLIGIVVWRKVQLTPVISPRSMSLQKHGTKNHTGGHSTVNDDMNRNNASFTPMNVPPPPILSKPPQPKEEDDVPPGFGPAGQRDDDDLPEFNFSGGPNQPPSRPNPSPVPGHRMGSRQPNVPQTPARQVDQMRELIQKYGQNGNNSAGGIPTQPWNDDDDDIPEWQPQASHSGPQSVVPQPIHNPAISPPHMTPHQAFRRPLQPPIAHQIQPLQPPMSVQQQRMWWPYGVNSVGNLPSGQFNGTTPNAGHLPRNWRPNNGSNNNGF